MHILLSGIPVEIKKKNIKNMHLYVKPPEGHVEVSAPMNMSEESIELFLRTKLGWIRKQQEKFKKQERQSAREYVYTVTNRIISVDTVYLFVVAVEYGIELIVSS